MLPLSPCIGFRVRRTARRSLATCAAFSDAIREYVFSLLSAYHFCLFSINSAQYSYSGALLDYYCEASLVCSRNLPTRLPSFSGHEKFPCSLLIGRPFLLNSHRARALRFTEYMPFSLISKAKLRLMHWAAS